MRFKNPALDRLWLWVIGIAFVIWVPIWIILSIERMGLRFVALALFIALCWRFRPKPDLRL